MNSPVYLNEQQAKTAKNSHDNKTTTEVAIRRDKGGKHNPMRDTSTRQRQQEVDFVRTSPVSLTLYSEPTHTCTHKHIQNHSANILKQTFA